MANTPEEDTSLYQILTITHITEEAEDVKLFTLEATDSAPVMYTSGQYLTLVHKAPFEEVRRSYSITSSPALQEPLTIGVKRIENGFFSRQLVDHAKVGNKILTTGAAGFFTLPEDTTPYKQVFFLAAGSGITPIFSLLKTVLYAHPHLAVVLLYSNSSRETTMFLEELEQLATDFSNRLHIEFINSNSPNLLRARLHKDLLRTYMDELAIAPYDQVLFYLCGPLNYMRMAFYVLRQEDVPEENIRKETFNAIKTAPPKVLPPDLEHHHVELRFRNKSFSLACQYPDTILKAARKVGVTLPYSCETGRCGNCVARVVSGKVWMSYNEVLSDRETNQGLVLTCVGYPVEGDVVLDIL
ncbi:flavin reductase family protein [Pontibacter ruber]|uniref:Flavin reductase family protein n=1 Tax=Pontibacter ruber TaxID=1343895 RepID=A0ABW5CYE3_9BACT|nr:iron-sulfur cluster-binding domain-containing protein [Pontibacter ruber]